MSTGATEQTAGPNTPRATGRPSSQTTSRQSETIGPRDTGIENEPSRRDTQTNDGTAAPDDRVALEEQLRWALADLDNLRKRFAREVAHERVAERERVLAEWLPIADDLGRALEHAGDRSDPFVQGVRDIYLKVQSLLARFGYPAFDDTGQEFDATRHEVVAVVEDSSAPPKAIVATVRPGYGSPDRLLRPAGVVVSSPPT